MIPNKYAITLCNKYATSAKCPKCGHYLYTSDLSNYAFVCLKCDENFYSVEIKENLSDIHEINIVIPIEDFKNHLPELQKIADKYDCRFLGFDDVAGFMDIGWDNHFPSTTIIQSMLREIEKVLSIPYSDKPNNA